MAAAENITKSEKKYNRPPRGKYAHDSRWHHISPLSAAPEAAGEMSGQQPVPLDDHQAHLGAKPPGEIKNS